MNPHQRSDGKQQSDNGGKEPGASSARAGSAQRDKLAAPAPSDALPGASSQRQDMPTGRESNDVAGGMPKRPRGHHLAADQKMDDDTGLSNTVNRQAPEPEQNLRQERQSNVGRRSDGTPD